MLMVTSVLVSTSKGEDPVYFPDVQLQAAIEKELGFSSPTPSDMLVLTRLDLIGKGIEDLSGIEYAINLKRLSIRYNHVSDLSPLAGLSRLEHLNISRNSIGNLWPLSGLTELYYLNAHENKIENISPLASLKKLSRLVLRGNQISDLSPLAGLTRLTVIEIGHNDLVDLSPLRHMSELSKLDFFMNSIQDITPLSELRGLRYLSLSYNSVRDISSLGNLDALGTLHLKRTDVEDISPLLNLGSLTCLTLDYNPLNLRAYTEHIDHIIANNPGIRITYPSFLGNQVQKLHISSTAGGFVFEPGEGTFEFDAFTRVEVNAQASPGFMFSHWSGSVTSTDNPLIVTVDHPQDVRACFSCLRETLYVDAGGPESGVDANIQSEDGSPERPFNTIQEALDVATDRALIIVNGGIYHENIDFLGKCVSLSGINPNVPEQSAYPVISGGYAGPVVIFSGGEPPDCVMAHFVITQGKGELAGAIYCSDSRPCLQNCLIIGNRSTDPSSGTIYCIKSQPTFVNCTVADNVAGTSGASLYLCDSDPIVKNSIIWGNEPEAIRLEGISRPALAFSNIDCSYSVDQAGNLSVDPLFAEPGFWVDPENPQVRVVKSNPEAAWIVGDYHLSSRAGRWDMGLLRWIVDQDTSPGIDAGNPEVPTGLEPRPHGGVINLGAYGGTTEASKSTIVKDNCIHCGND